MLSPMPRLLFASLVVFVVAPAVCVSQVNERSAIREPVKLILDTDMSGDCDDAGALALLHALADRGECEILAVVTNRRDLTDASAAAVDAINTYYGRGDIPIGTDKNGPTALQRASPYTIALRDEFDHDAPADKDAKDAIDVYRRALIAEADQSVTICSIGAFSNLAELARVAPELVRTKVQRLVVMGGHFPKSNRRETNIATHVEAAQYVADRWPGEIVWHGFEVGQQLVTGAKLKTTPKNNPVRRTYELRPMPGKKMSIDNGKPSYDQAAALYAVRGAEPKVWQVIQNGRVEVKEPGITSWLQEPPREKLAAHSYVKIASSPQQLADEIEELMVAPPRKLADENVSDEQRKIRELEEMADLALVPPTPNLSPLPEYSYENLDYGMTIGIAQTPGGRLWACWVAGGDSPKAFFVVATSDDDGESWTQPRLVLDSHSSELPRPRSILVGNLWTDPNGKLWLFFDQSMDMFDGRGGVWAIVCENPDADNPEWSTPRRIWHGVTLNKPTVLSNGDWMLPVSLDERGGLGAFRNCFQNLDPLRGANVFVSKDQGETWHRRGRATFPNPDWHEHMIVQRNNDSLWMLARTRKGIMESTSVDGGQTWSGAVASKIKHPNARFHVRRLQSGRLLLIKHGEAIDSHRGRVALSAWLSDDEGQTWFGGLMLDERKGISYPDGFQSSNGSIYISYDRNRATDGEVLMARFTEADIEARKLVSPNSKLRCLISKPLATKPSANR
ncbi:exo-alpha-sialidase [Rhodopirellula europaea]|jgi:inosine-uridine nucleoside N-ribohydrolase|uniref:Secreted protein containing Inosine/uridine-preferring nucleoside hydrolase domain protein n=1 Tax=Rhodopirellula europaea SH398 TaxID=1263868 RepID=M5RWC1_9BACT|nr:exo-alpha-sialidase [Rhodopirellula europaea]EMI23643.1 secreted protein containing Inosine/uridine-preferring nucleoside hydrolase domain protein [Rhodopirellula europaea SH398]